MAGGNSNVRANGRQLAADTLKLKIRPCGKFGAIMTVPRDESIAILRKLFEQTTDQPKIRCIRTELLQFYRKDHTDNTLPMLIHINGPGTPIMCSCTFDELVAYVVDNDVSALTLQNSRYMGASWPVVRRELCDMIKDVHAGKTIEVRDHD